jgi:hypothetical protein
MTKLHEYGDYEVVRINGEIVILYNGDCVETCEDHLDAVRKMNLIIRATNILAYAN